MALSTALFGTSSCPLPRATVVCTSPTLPIVPSTTVPSVPPWRRTRSPTRTGREPISTRPAITLPSVLCAARPSTTAVSAPPTAIARGFDVHEPQCHDHDHQQRHELDEEADGRGGAGVEATEQPRAENAPDVPGEAPADRRQQDRDGDPHGGVRAEDVLPVDPEQHDSHHDRDQRDRLAAGAAGAAGGLGGQQARERGVLVVLDVARAGGVGLLPRPPARPATRPSRRSSGCGDRSFSRAAPGHRRGAPRRMPRAGCCDTGDGSAPA